MLVIVCSLTSNSAAASSTAYEEKSLPKKDVNESMGQRNSAAKARWYF
jgi:hypothetical protein